jgi:hypothetical protein
MTTTHQSSRRDLALTIITAIIGVAATAFAIAATAYMFAL